MPDPDETVESTALVAAESATPGLFHRGFGALIKVTNGLGILALGGTLLAALVTAPEGVAALILSELLGLWMLGSALTFLALPVAVALPRTTEDGELHHELAIATPLRLTLTLSGAVSGVILLVLLILAKAAAGG